MTQSHSRSPVAIIGMACRFPGGVSSTDQFWNLLRRGGDAITKIPSDRWFVDAFYDPNPTTPGKTYARFGGFVDNVEAFDAQFFGISPREAVCIDPQHRLLMEIAWEAVECAGLSPNYLAGSNTGVFIGISTCDYGGIQTAPNERSSISPYTNLGLGMCIAANRLSYFFDLHGPSFAVDTACSSSLVAVHLACQSIWNGECLLAFVGGVNAILRPEGTIGFSKSSMLAPDGHCKSFDARADGYVRSEGAGMILLKRLDQALRDKDQILAVIRGTAINQDGRTGGIALPNGAAQEAMLREAYQRAEVSPNLVQYVEAHGTGTSAGDPIEVNALGRVLGENRTPGSECLLGSVKSNIGHLEAASGIAGLIKAVLCIQHDLIPANPTFETPNPDIPFNEYQFRVPQKLERWPHDEHRVIGINSFGFGGTNAHVILDAPPALNTNTHPPKMDDGEQPPMLFPLSARATESLKAYANAYREFLTTENENGFGSLADICASTSLRKAHHNYRAAFVVRSKADLSEYLRIFVDGENRPEIAEGRRVSGDNHNVVFVFSGMGQQWWAMGHELILKEAVFRETIERCDALLQQYSDWSLLQELARDQETSRIHETQIAQPTIFALQVALAAQWRAWGIEPKAVVGHSVGEVAAACVAGVLSLEDAVQLIYHRSRLQARTAGQGRMLAVSMPVEEVDREFGKYDGQVCLAAINSPNDITLSGDADALDEIAASLKNRDIFQSFLQVEVPYHSGKMDPLETEFRESLKGLQPQPALITMFSTTTGERIEGPELDASYWWRNIRRPVNFDGAVRQLVESGHNRFIELSGHPVLAFYISQCLAQANKEGTVLPSLRRDESDLTVMLSSLAKLYVVGYPVDWQRLYPQGGRLLKMPSYPWKRERYWNESERSERERRGVKIHPMLGNRVDAAAPLWEVDLNKQVLTYLNDHRVQGTIMCPGAAYVEMALAVCKQSFGTLPFAVEDLRFEKALFLSGDEAPRLQLSCDPNQASFAIYSHGTTAESWTQHVTGKFYRLQQSEVSESFDLAEIRQRCSRRLSKEDCYKEFDKLDINYGPYFQSLEQIYGGQGEALGDIRIHKDLDAGCDQYILHPVILDGCFQVILGTMALSEDHGNQVEGTYLPVGVESIRLYERPEGTIYAYAKLEEQRRSHSRGSIWLLDSAGRTIGEIRGLTCRAIDETGQRIDSYLYEYTWQLKPLLSSGDSTGRQVNHFPRPSEITEQLADTTAKLCKQLGRHFYYQAIESPISEWAVAQTLKSLQRLGCKFDQQPITTPELAAQLGVLPEYERLLDRLMRFLVEAGKVEQKEQNWTFVPGLEVHDPKPVWQFSRQHPDYLAELMLAQRCGDQLDQVLIGAVDPLDLIFPDGSLNTLEHLYQDSPSYRCYNLMVRQALEQLRDHFPSRRKLRVLELGGGTGGMTAYVLKILPPGQTEYVFTDLTQMLLGHAEQKFHEHNFIKYQVLDISEDPLAQSFEAHSFDIILASDVLHATPDLRQTLANVRSLLASNGLLVLLEGTRMSHWAVLIFGLLKGWWLFRDTELRKADPWLSLEEWRQLLLSSEFVDVGCITDLDEGGLHSVILAQGPQVDQGTSDVLAGAAAESKPGNWLIFADQTGFSEQLAERLRRRGESVTLVSPRESFESNTGDSFGIRVGELEDIRQVVGTWFANPAECRGIIHAWSLDAPSSDGMTTASLEAAQREGVLSVLQLCQVLDVSDVKDKPTVWLITAGAESAGQPFEDIAVAQSTIWGLGRVIKNELLFTCKLVDLSSKPSSEECELFFQELWAEDEEDEIAIRGSSRYAHRLIRTSLEKVHTKSQEGAGVSNDFQVEMPSPGILSKLTYRKATRRAPAPGEIEIEVKAASLNFKDVVVALGLLPDEALEGGFTGKSLGMECAGDIVAIGEGVEGFEIGDAVLAAAPGALRTHLTIDSSFAVKKPPQITYEAAATIPIAFLTAHYSLNCLAQMQKGDRVLIHAAAGGVGLAALQLAQQAGAEIFATAGSREKRDLLRAMGIQHVMDSRSLTFADDVLAATDGQGVDIVLNSLSGLAIAKSLAVLSSYGRFVEIGKRDIYENNKLEMRPFRKNLSYFAVDLDRLCVDRKPLIQSLLGKLMQGMSDGSLHPLVHRSFAVSDITNAFRYMAQAKHVGKVIVSFEFASVKVTPPSPPKLQFRSDATYLVTGGLGGFGLAVADWLVENGARNLVLVGRRGAATDEAKAGVERLERSGANVQVVAADIGQMQPVVDMLQTIRETMPPLRGIIHAAMVIDDTVLKQLDWTRLNGPLGPKVYGAWNLHQATLDDPLDLFVCFSSFTSMFGNPGQGNYVTANAFLDAFAHHRRAKGLPALTINWGVVGDVGYVAQNAEIAPKLEHVGMMSTPVRKFLSILGDLIRHQGIQIGVAEINWTRLAGLPMVHGSQRFTHLLESISSETGDDLGGNMLDALLATAAEKRHEFLVEQITKRMGRVLGTSDLDTEQSLLNMGLDSLMALEIGNQIQADVGVKIPPVKFMEGLSISGLATLIIQQVAGDDDSRSGSEKPSGSTGLSEALVELNAASDAELGEKVDSLSEEQIEAMIGELLSEEEQRKGTSA